MADTGSWLSGREVLISPFSLGKVDRDVASVDVKLTRQQVEKSPGIDTHQPVSRQNEADLYNYYGYPYYWPGPYLWGPVPWPGGLAATHPQFPQTEAGEIQAAEKRKRKKDFHLRSIKEVTEYHIEASDGDIGHVEDFIIDDENWAIRYIIVDTRNWWPGKKVPISPEWIKEISWTDSAVYVDLPREAIKTSPEYDSDAGMVSRDYEKRLFEHYGQAQYWSSSSSHRERGEWTHRS